MRLVVEIEREERENLRKFCRSFTPELPYSDLVRTLLRMAYEGRVKRDDLTAPLSGSVKLVEVASKPAPNEKPKVRKGWDAPKGTR